MTYLAGIDVGSTTVKFVILNEDKNIIFTSYERHFSDVLKTVQRIVDKAIQKLGKDVLISLNFTGSSGMDLAEKLAIPFVQEVIACTKTIEDMSNDVDVAIELGGEDAKITFFAENLEQRMNGSCAGGTGAFIDQMSSLLETDPKGLNELAKNYQNIYPIASRCGVFAKTDIQPLINEGARREDIAASIFQAVVNQTITGLASGRKICGKIALLGGPLHFLSELRTRFIETLKITPENVFCPGNSQLFVAIGAALLAKDEKTISLHELAKNFFQIKDIAKIKTNNLEPLFNNEEELELFRQRHAQADVPRRELTDYQGPVFLGIDVGSTTSKVILLSLQKEILFSYYGNNEGQPLENIRLVLQDLYKIMPRNVYFANACVTGYGEKLLQNAFKIDLGEVETIAHYKAAAHFYPDVNFILDIGGQDMKALTIKDQTLASIQLNEACSSGCGSFIENFAKSLQISVKEFANLALLAKNPVDLGSRCTVFMNSKVKQVQKEGANLGDISAGLSYSVIKNALFKVIKMRETHELGEKIVVQGGTFCNEALLRAFEKIVGKNVLRPTIAGLMGAFGAALLAIEATTDLKRKSSLLSQKQLNNFSLNKEFARCGLCSNNCALTINHFSDGRSFISGNRCERGAVRFNHQKASKRTAKINLYDYKYRKLFNYRPKKLANAPLGTIGVPRVLNMYENYPLWFSVLDELGFQVILSPPSSKELYETGLETIPSDTVCYPAKIAHGAIYSLLNQGITRIFYPSVVYEQIENEQAPNHFNCPVVQSYPEVIAGNIEEIVQGKIIYHQPFLNLANQNSVIKQLFKEFANLGITKKKIKNAVEKGYFELTKYKNNLHKKGEELLKKVAASNEKAIVLAGRPYHVDPEINHGIAQLIAEEGFHVLTEDAIAHLGNVGNLRVVNQWTYHARLYAAAQIVSRFKNLELVQLNSFGCGIDAITSDQVAEILAKSGKIYTLLKIDEGSNLGALKIRLRSLKAAINERERQKFTPKVNKKITHFPNFVTKMKKDYTILMPVLSPIHQFDLLDEALKSENYQVVTLPALDARAIDVGLRYVNNDACYPAIIVIGQLIEALQSGQFTINKTAVMMTQTGGGCRATNYLALLRKALKDAGFGNVPVISLSFNNQGVEKTPGFKFTPRMLKKVLVAVFYGDLFERVIYRMRPYEKIRGSVNELHRFWLNKVRANVRNGSFKEFNRQMRQIIHDFDNIAITNEQKVRVGLVGEILVKYAPTANNNIVSLLEAEGVEVVVPDILGFFNYSLYNQIFKYQNLGASLTNDLLAKTAIKLIEIIEKPMNQALQASKHFSGIKSIHELAKNASKVISLGNQTGEGWFLTGEMIELLQSGIDNIICMQPFGCLPNHVVGKGVLRKLRHEFEKANITPIDYDPGASFVNQLNRIRLMLATAKNKLKIK